MGELITTYVKSNDMISAKYMSNLIENQIMAIALSRIEESKNGELETKLYPRDLYSMIEDKSNIYKSLIKVSKTITGHSMLLEDGNGNFKAFSIIPNADYQDGVFTIKFNSELKKHILDMEDRYATFEINLMKSFKNNSSFRIYELLKKDFYKARKTGTYDVEYNLSELKFMIGCANSDNEAHRNRLAAMGKNIDWDELYAKLDKSDKKYENSADFKKWVLDVAKKELDEKADLSFWYEEGKKKKKKVLSIVFHMYKNNPSNSVISTVTVDVKNNKEALCKKKTFSDIYPDLYNEFVGHNELTDRDLDILIEKSNGDLDRIKDAIKYVDEYSHRTVVTNYMGTIIKCIQDDWTATAVAKGSSEFGNRIVDLYEAKINQSPEDIEKTAMSVWNRQKSKSDKWSKFEQEFEFEYGMTPEEAEKKYTYNDLYTNAYAPFIRNEKMNLKIIKEKEVIEIVNESELNNFVGPVKKRVVRDNPKRKLWEKAKNRVEFVYFEKMIKEEYGYEMEDLEVVYSYDELFNAFKEYQNGEVVNL